MKRQMITALLCVPARCAVALCALAGSPAWAEDPAAGAQIAKSRCAACHVVEGEGPPPARKTQAPSFSAIANGPNISRSFLDSWLSAPHPGHGMPNFFLTHTEVQDVSAYIFSLRAARPPAH